MFRRRQTTPFTVHGRDVRSVLCLPRHLPEMVIVVTRYEEDPAAQCPAWLEEQFGETLECIQGPGDGAEGQLDHIAVDDQGRALRTLVSLDDALEAGDQGRQGWARGEWIDRSLRIEAGENGVLVPEVQVGEDDVPDVEGGGIHLCQERWGGGARFPRTMSAIS